jgi:hypothetical protein
VVLERWVDTYSLQNTGLADICRAEDGDLDGGDTVTLLAGDILSDDGRFVGKRDRHLVAAVENGGIGRLARIMVEGENKADVYCGDSSCWKIKRQLFVIKSLSKHTVCVQVIVKKGTCS